MAAIKGTPADRYDIGYAIGRAEGHAAGYGEGYEVASTEVRKHLIAVVSKHLSARSITDTATVCDRIGYWLRREQIAHFGFARDVLDINWNIDTDPDDDDDDDL